MKTFKNFDIKFNPNKSWPVFIENDGKHKGSINDILVVHGHAKYFEQDKNDLLDDLHESVSVANGFWPNSQLNHRNVPSHDTLIPPSQENVDAYKSEALVKFIEDTELFKKEIERAPSAGEMNFKSTAIEPNKMTAEIKTPESWSKYTTPKLRQFKQCYSYTAVI